MTAAPLTGILNVDKPLGWTSHDVVGLVRRLTGLRQVGHAGTLDPLATGVLLVMVGSATRLSDHLMHARKCYLAQVSLGVRTRTDDAEGEVVAEHPIAGIGREQIIAALTTLRGDLLQIPPAYAAIKRDGVPAYQLARQGRLGVGSDNELPARPVRVEGLAVLGVEGPLLRLLVWCSAGTYIRALARDLGDLLGCGAHLGGLRRLSSGAFTVAEACDVATLRALSAADRLAERLYPPDTAVATWPAVLLDAAATAAVAHGNAVPVAATAAIALDDDALVRLYSNTGALLALARYRRDAGVWQPRTVFPADSDERKESTCP